MHRITGAIILAALLAGCGGQAGYRPIAPDKVLLWDRQTEDSAELLQDIVAEFNEQHPGLPVEAQYSGGYADIFRKLMNSIQARALPAMAVSYESMTTEYIQAGAVAALDAYVHDPGLGLSEEELADFFPGVIETNTYESFGGKMYSFPFAKSVLMMYCNKDVLAEAGIGHAAATWDEFLQHCRQIKERTGKYGYAVSIDASTIDAMIYAFGGKIVTGTTTHFDSGESVAVFRFFETLAQEDLGFMIPGGSYEDRQALVQGRAAYMLRSSTSLPFLREDLADNLGALGVAPIPQSDPANPVTVLFGPNMCIFNIGGDQQKRAWEFIRFFTAPGMNVRWALHTGYQPIRKSAAEDPRIQEFWAEYEFNRLPFDCLHFARPEPNVPGWQEVRDLIERAQTGVMTGKQTGEEAAAELKKDADAVLARTAEGR